MNYIYEDIANAEKVSTLHKIMLSFILDNPTATNPEIGKAFRLSGNCTRQHIYLLKKAGHLNSKIHNGKRELTVVI